LHLQQLRTHAFGLPMTFRRAMRTLTSAVSVVSTAHEGARFGMTATAVTSLSMDPPSLLVCINRAAGLHGPLLAARRFCLNILRADQAELAQAFGGGRAGEERFGLGDWRDTDGLPALDGAQANVFCEVDAVFRYATHSIVVGLVTAVRVSDVVTPLIYQDGRYTVGLGEGVDWVVPIA
jgi:flavin reductase